MSDTSRSAFPQPHFVNANGDVQWGDNGMTLRDWFAGQALAGLLAEPSDAVCASNTPEGIEAERRAYAVNTAKAAYRYADAMILIRQESDDHE